MISTLLNQAQTRNKPFAIYSTIGLKAGVGLMSLDNANMKIDDNIEYSNGLNYSFGLKTSVNFIGKRPINAIFGVHVDFLADKFNLEFATISVDNNTYHKNIDYLTKNTSITARYTNVSRRYFFESGVQLSRFMVVDHTNTNPQQNIAAYTTGYNYRSNYQNYHSLVIGLGVYVESFVMSIKQTVSLSSLTAYKSNPISDGYYNNEIANPNYEKIYGIDNPTRLYTAQITLEYYIPFIKFKRYWQGRTKVSAFKMVAPVYYWGRELD